ncbi:RHS repeat-associated core domain-containing protein [Tolypothrix bouteillei VB521301_2]|uniref:Tox-PL-2 domain-containing protein n=1 Tax=Tolypothrix bouteillei VB521301 TaxID=1479485 RepID=A0A0C1NG96_9CYAN
MTDRQASITDTYTYDAFGKLIGSSGSTDNNYLFTGEQYDEDLEQYYLRQRYYDPNTGRFTRRDVYEGRLEEPLTLHKYLYANGNPVNLIDPSGLNAILAMSPDASWGIAIVTTIIAVLTAVRMIEIGIELGSYIPEHPKGFNKDSPKLGVRDNTAHKPEQTLIRGILGRVGGSGGFNERTNLSIPSHTGHSGLADTMRNLLTNVFYIDPLDTDLDLPEIKKITGRANRIGGCDVLAGQIENYFIKEGIPQSGRHIRLETGFNTGEGAYIVDRTTGDVIGTAGYHEGIIVNIDGQEVVFDNLNPNGQLKEAWLQRFYTYGLQPEIGVIESSLGDRNRLGEYNIRNIP